MTGGIMGPRGEEYELRQLSAAEYIAATGEAEKLEELLEGGSGGRNIALAACLIARGAFADDERFFSSATEVLESMTAREIMDAAQDYLLPSEDPRSGRNSGSFAAAAPGSPDEVQGYLSGGPTLGNTSYRWEYGGEDADTRRRVMKFSDVIERDSRRYDGAFEIY